MIPLSERLPTSRFCQGLRRIGTRKINCKDFSLTWNAALETGGILIGDEVTITLDIEFVKA